MPHSCVYLSISLNSSARVRRCLRCQRGGLHHLPRLSSGVPASSELSLDHHSAGALAAHCPQFQPALRDREAGLQVRRRGGRWEYGGFLKRGQMDLCHNSEACKTLFSIRVKLLWPIRTSQCIIILAEWWFVVTYSLVCCKSICISNK